MPPPSLIAAVDIGGTKIAAGLVSSVPKVLGTVLQWSVRSTEGMTRSAEEVVEAVLIQWEDLLAELEASPQQLAGVAVAFPGNFEPVTERVLTAPNVPAFIGRRPRCLFLRGVEARWGLALPVAAENDTLAAVSAECEKGAGRGFERVIYLTISTGFGGAMLERRMEGAAPRLTNLEPGLSTFPDPIRPEHPLDLLSSGVGIAQEARAELRRILAEEGEAGVERATAVLAPLPGTTAERIEALGTPEIAKAAAAGDPFCQLQMETAATFAALGIEVLILRHRPDRIVVGGSVALRAQGYVEAIRHHLAERLPREEFDPSRQLVLAELGDDRGILGAAAFLR